MPGKRVAIVQSSCIPWKGYFDLIRAVDEFVLFDDVPFTKRDWRSRNRIKTQHGPQWLTIPVMVKGRYTQRIRDAVVDDAHWADSTGSASRVRTRARPSSASSGWRWRVSRADVVVPAR